MEFSRDFYLRASDFDTYDRLTPRAILELFQDVAGNHAEEMGIGFKPLYEKNLIWVIARTKYIVEKKINRYTGVKVKTWPLTPGKLTFRREYLIYDNAGDIAVRGCADWVIVNRIEHSLASGVDIFPKGEYSDVPAIDEKLRRIKDIDGKSSEPKTVIPQFTDIDLNGHVNNTKYADFAINALPKDEREIVSFQIDYHNEALVDEPLILSYVTDGKKAVVKGKNADEVKKFTCEIMYK